MIPILYNGDETRFVTNGIGRLSDCTRAVVTEERNGIYELEFDMPITGEHFEDITLGKIVACTHDDKHDIQPFIVYQKSIPDLNGIVTFNAHHISYRLCDVVVMPFTASSVVDALNKIGTNSVNVNPFSFWTDKTTTATFKNDIPRLARNMLGGEENSILDVYGSGEYEFDKFDVKLYAHRGTDTSVEIRYGKNLSDLNQTISDEFSYNAVVPYWAGSEGELVTLPEKMIAFSGVQPQIADLTDHNLIIIRAEDNEPIEVAYTVVDAVPMDLSDVFEEQPTVAQLRSAAVSRFQNSGAWLPDENIEVNFVQLWQTEEYKEYAALQRVSLCDTVSVYYPQGGVSVNQKVVKVDYNVLSDRYDSIELGSLQTSLGQAIETKIMENVPTKSMMDSAIEYATDLIRGGLGGYVVMTPGANGYPQEILIMDTPDINTAVNVWRFNQGGLGHSHNGYNGPFSDIALTQDGRINASMITTGIINANLIQTGALDADLITTGTLNANLIKAGVLQDVNGNVSWNLATGILNMKRGSINLGNGNFKVSDSGYLYSEYGKIGGFYIDADSLYYQDSESKALVDPYQITLINNLSDGGRGGTRIEFDGIYFLYRADTSSWSMNTKARIFLSEENALSFVVGSRTPLNIWSTGTYSSEFGGATLFDGNVHINNKLTVSGTKSRRVKTDNYSDRLLYAYETPTPLFGDIGEAVIDADGFCYVDLDDIFTETIDKQEYQVFLQKEGEGDCWIAEKNPRYFVIQGTPDLKVAWELKAKQRGYGTERLEQFDNGLEEYEDISDILDEE